MADEKEFELNIPLAVPGVAAEPHPLLCVCIFKIVFNFLMSDSCPDLCGCFILYLCVRVFFIIVI